FQHEIKLLRAGALVQRVRASGRQPPEPRAEILASGALQIIRVRDAHQVGGPPVQVARRDEVVTLDAFHEFPRGRETRSEQNLDPERAAERPGAIVRLRTVVTHEDAAVAALT